MGDRELDKAIAEALGWTVRFHHQENCYSLRNHKGQASLWFYGSEHDAERARAKLWELGIPPFSSSMNHAWTLVEILRDEWTEATKDASGPPLPGHFRNFEAPFDDGAFFEILHRHADRRWPWAFLYVTPEVICTAFLYVKTGRTWGYD